LSSRLQPPPSLSLFPYTTLFRSTEVETSLAILLFARSSLTSFRGPSAQRPLLELVGGNPKRVCYVSVIIPSIKPQGDNRIDFQRSEERRVGKECRSRCARNY